MGSDHSGNLRQLHPIKFYRDLKKTKTMAAEQGDQLKQQIKLTAKIESAEDGSSYRVTVSADKTNRNTLLSTSELKTDFSHSINFQEFMVMDYYFEIEQPFIVQIIKDGNNYETINTTLGTIFGSRNNTFTQNLSKGEVISIISVPLSDTQEYLNINLQTKNYSQKDLTDWSKKCYYLISNQSKIYQSEALSDSGNFSVTNIPTNLLNPQFKIEFFNYKNKLVHSVNCSVADFVN